MECNQSKAKTNFIQVLILRFYWKLKTNSRIRMKTKMALALLLIGLANTVAAQDGVDTAIAALNRQIDAAVVQKDGAKLRQWYADDFVFTHGTGLVEGKESWLRTVMDTATHYLSRSHDSLTTEVHGRLAIVYGKLTVQRATGKGISKYELWYVRVFEKRKRHWQLVSHRTVSERHLP